MFPFGWLPHTGAARALFFASVAAACGEHPPQESGDDATPTESADGGAEPAAQSERCTRDPVADPVEAQQFDTLHASVVDQDGVPVRAESAQVCGFDVCLMSEVAESGEVDFEGGLTMLAPAFKLGFGLAFAKFAFRLSGATTDLGTTVAVRLPPFEGAALLEPSATSTFTATSSGITLTLEAGTVLRFDALTYRSSERGFRAVILPADRRPHAVGSDLDGAVVVALSPIETTFCPSARLSVPNVDGWPAGTELEFLLHGASITQTFAPYGGWQSISTGAVTADGARLETAEGQGLPALSAVAIRPLLERIRLAP
jgi:hypothetical protein